jgi:hypothetical protein
MLERAEAPHEAFVQICVGRRPAWWAFIQICVGRRPAWWAFRSDLRWAQACLVGISFRFALGAGLLGERSFSFASGAGLLGERSFRVALLEGLDAGHSFRFALGRRLPREVLFSFASGLGLLSGSVTTNRRSPTLTHRQQITNEYNLMTIAVVLSGPWIPLAR